MRPVAEAGTLSKAIPMGARRTVDDADVRRRWRIDAVGRLAAGCFSGLSPCRARL